MKGEHYEKLRKLTSISLASALFLVTTSSVLVNTVKADDGVTSQINSNTVSDTKNIQNKNSDETTNTNSSVLETSGSNILNNTEALYSSDVFLANKTSGAPLVRIAPNPTGEWKKMGTKKWKADKVKDLELGLLGLIGYSYSAPAVAFLLPMVSNHVPGYPVWITGSGYYKSGKYVNLYKITVTLYKNSSRTKKISSTTYNGRIVKQTTFARRKTIKPSESPMSSFTY